MLYIPKNNSIIVEFKLEDGKIIGYSQEQIEKGNAIGLIKQDKISGLDMYSNGRMWIFCSQTPLSVANFNVSPLELREKGKLGLKLK